MNHMEEIAYMLGVKLDEEFEIEGAPNNPYLLQRDGMVDRTGRYSAWWLMTLLSGEAKIV